MRVLTTFALALVASLALSGGMALAGNPSDDGDCAATVTDPFLNATGSRADLYGCKPMGNSGEEHGIYVIHGSADELGYPGGGQCTVLVRWSGNYGGTPYLDYGTVFNQAECSSGYGEVWGDRFDANDPYGATPYVFTIKGEGDQVHHQQL